MKRHLGGAGFRSVLKSTLIGVPLPLCSCGVIPTALSMKKKGASDGACIGFLISTPQTGVDSILVSVAFLGIPFALFKVASAFLTGLLGGLLADWFQTSGTAVPTEAAGEAGEKEEKESCGFKERFQRLFAHADELLYTIWRWLLAGILISALISTWVPANALAQSPWVKGLGGMGLILLISLPLYVCATASVPIAATLVGAGFPGGAALVFLMAGPASNIATIGAVWKAFGRRSLGIYLTVIVFCSIGFGLAFDFLSSVEVRESLVSHRGGTVFASIAAVILLLLMVRYAWGDFRAFLAGRRAATGGKGGKDWVRLQVGGMTCQGCARRVREALQQIAGVQDVRVDLDRGIVLVEGASDLEPDVLYQAIQKAGFTCTL